jgi:rod shape-determining protein MreD
MIYLFYVLTGLALILLQSLVLGFLLPPGLIYDLQIPLVVYLALFHPNSKTLLLILFLGLIMDGVTGGAMGIYMLIYFWLFAGVQLAVHFLQKDNFVLMSIAILLGVLLEYSLFLTVAGLSGRGVSVGADMTGGMVGRLITAGLTGPVLVSALKWGYHGMAADPDTSRVDLPEATSRRTRSRGQSAADVLKRRGCGQTGSAEE